MSQNKTNNTNNTTTTMKGVQNMNKNTRLIEAMSWQSLKEKYFIGTMNINGKPEKINQLADAIEAGELDALVKECADKYHDGDIYQVYVAWSKNLSSMQTNMKKKAYIANADIEWTRYNVLRAFVTSRMEGLKGTGRAGNSKAYWQWTIEEIEAIPVEDLRTIKSVYDNMASKKSKYPELIEELDDFDARFAAATAKYSAAKKAAKAAQISVDDSLLAKLTKGGSAVLTKAEAQQLAEILQKLNK